MTAPPADEGADQPPAHVEHEAPELLTEPVGAVVELRALSADEHAGTCAFIANRGSGALHRLELHVVGGARQSVSVVEVDLPTPTLLPGEACVIGLPQPPQRNWGLRLTWLTDHGPGQSATVLSGADETVGHRQTRTAPKVQVTQ